MFNKLQTKWNVSAGKLLLIITTFAVGGSLCGYVGRKLLSYANVEKGVLWVLAYVVTVTLLWPLAVLLVSIPLGQFSFFKRYLHNLLRKIRGKRQESAQNQTHFK